MSPATDSVSRPYARLLVHDAVALAQPLHRDGDVLTSDDVRERSFGAAEVDQAAGEHDGRDDD